MEKSPKERLSVSTMLNLEKIVNKFFLLALGFLPIGAFAEKGYIIPWGRDAALCIAPTSTHVAGSLSPMGKLAEAIILFHHKFITQIDGPRSHFRPTSSTYMLKAIRKHGFVKGYILGCDRLLRENEDPWHYRMRLIDGKLYKWDPPPE